MRTGIIVELSASDREHLAAIVADRNSPQKHVWRAHIVLLTADGSGTAEIMRRTGTSKTAVWRWQERFMTAGVAGLLRDKTRPSRIPPLGIEVVQRVVACTLADPPGETTHWTAGSMAKAIGISVSSVQRIWRKHGLQPHRMRQFKLSNDPKFASKLREIVGLYVDPPAHTVVLSIDEKSQIQALERTQPGLPWKKGRCGTMTHEYKRHGTTTLFAAMNTQDGTVIDVCMPKHRHQEWIKFLQLIRQRTPGDKDVHLIMDNYSAHKDPAVQKWLAKQPRFHVHFTPTSSSWLNMVERFFRALTDKCIRRGVFHDVNELEQAIHHYIDRHNQRPKPYLWTAKATDILEKVKRAWAALRARGYVPKNQKFVALQSIDRRLSAELA